MSKSFEVLSPLEGTVVPLEQVPDPVFSEHMLGDGLAILPRNSQLIAPVSGTIVNLNKALHAIVIRNKETEILIHVGLETVALNGEGFKAFVKEGDSVTAGQKLLEFDLDILQKKAASPLVLVVVTSPTDAALTEKISGVVRPGQPLYTVSACAEHKPLPDMTVFCESGPITLLNPNGLHARPAAVLANLAAQYPYDILVFHGKQTANAKSIVGLMGLSLCANDQLVLRVYGPQEEADEMLVKLHEAFQNGLGEKELAAPAPQPQPSATDEIKLPARVKGLSACAGLASGPAYLLAIKTLSFEENAVDQQEECAALEHTLHTLTKQMEAQIAEEKNTESRDILNAHLLLLRDPLLIDTTRQTILQGKTAAFAFNTAIRQSIDILKKTKNRFLMERIADLKDVRREVLCQLTGEQHRLPDITPGSIVIADDLLPSDVSALPEHIAGVLLANGSPTAHAGILLRNRNIPAVVQAGAAVLAIPPGTPLLLDADAASVQIAPSAEQQQVFEKRRKESVAENEQACQVAQEAAITKDGIKILVEGNVSNAEESARSKKAGADGLGLVRTEFLFQNRAIAPTEEEQQASYQAILDAAQGTVTFRTMDAGGDKPVPFVNIPPEENPIVGIRGVRAFKQNELFFRTQLRALLRVRPLNRIRIMLPMVSFVSELKEFKEIIEQEKKNLGISESVQLGIMIEVPAAALTAAQLAKEADFFSIGTNDLTQYTLAIDRGHKQLSPLADPLHPGVLKLIAYTTQGAKQYHKPVAVCGAVAADMAAVPLLIGLGITELAVGTGSVARTKALIRKLNVQACSQLAQQALELADAQAVRSLVANFLNK